MKPIKQSAPLNRSLHAARTDQQDEFYTQYVDLQTNAESRSRTSSRRLVGDGRRPNPNREIPVHRIATAPALQ